MNTMEAPDQEQVSLGSKEKTTRIIKGKRTKRVRPQSPILFTPTANSSDGERHREDHSHINAQDYNDHDDDDDIEGDKNHDNYAINGNMSINTSCSAELQQGSTEEEEEMANCLILLARGQSFESPKLFEDDDDNNNGLNYSEYSSRKFMEAVTMGYECKTCNKTFSSFQALGGHRASHKKPKACNLDSCSLTASFRDQEFQFKNKNPVPPQLNNNNSDRGIHLGINNKNKSKVHECSLCGAEFASGQALGGHMRRHRAVPVAVGTTDTTLSLTPMAALEADIEDQPKKRRKLLSLNLDLNLPPAAPEDDHREPKFAFGSNQPQQQQQQPSLVFSAPSLVDCHY